MCSSSLFSILPGPACNSPRRRHWMRLLSTRLLSSWLKANRDGQTLRDRSQIHTNITVEWMKNASIAFQCDVSVAFLGCGINSTCGWARCLEYICFVAYAVDWDPVDLVCLEVKFYSLLFIYMWSVFCISKIRNLNHGRSRGGEGMPEELSQGKDARKMIDRTVWSGSTRTEDFNHRRTYFHSVNNAAWSNTCVSSVLLSLLNLSHLNHFP